MKKIQLFEEYVTESKSNTETGLMVIGKTQIDNNKIGKIADKLGLYAEWNSKEGYWLFPEEEDMYDELEMELDKAFTKNNINARFEGIFESTVTEIEKNSKITEANRGKVYKAAKQGSYPAVIVVVQNGKVIHQEPVNMPDIAPATFNVMQERYPKATIHLEDKTGQRLYTESVINEAVNIKKVTGLVADLGWDYDRMSSSGQQTYDELCDLLGIK